MFADFRLPDDVFASLPLLVQTYIRYLEERVRQLEEKNHQLEQRVSDLEHRSETKQCPCCGHHTSADFPEGIAAFTQYGERVQALATYFHNQHLIPIDRVCEIFADIYGISLSAGTCVN